MSTSEQVASHYTTPDALQRIDAQLREQGIDPEHPTLEALAPYDNSHAGGLGATLGMIALANFPAGAQVLDVGGGMGGPARAQAIHSNVQVTVLDLTPSFVKQGRILTERMGLSDRVTLEVGDGAAMPFADESFDGAWTQHSTMNIENKAALYAEIHRVLRPGSRLVMAEVMAGNGEPLDFPVPWAGKPEFSFLQPAPAIRELIANTGFREVSWEDESAKVLGLVASMIDPDPSKPPPPKVAILGPSYLERVRNFGNNLSSGRIVMVRALFERV